jgi:hypothetical protein
VVDPCEIVTLAAASVATDHATVRHRRWHVEDRAAPPSSVRARASRTVVRRADFDRRSELVRRSGGSSGGRGARTTRWQGCVCLQAGCWCPRSAAASPSCRRRHRQAPSSRRPPQPVASLGRARRTRRGRDFHRLERARRLRQWSREARHCPTCSRTARPPHRHRSTSGRERGVGRCACTRRATTPGGGRRGHRRQVTVGQPLRGQTMERLVASRERREHARQGWRALTTGGLGNVAPQAPTRGAS